MDSKGKIISTVLMLIQPADYGKNRVFFFMKLQLKNDIKRKS